MIEINRIWAMPNKNTFDIKPIKELIYKYFNTLDDSAISIDPFANKSRICKTTNDIDPDFDTTYNMDALDFLKMFDNNSVDFVLYDSPFSPRQVSECYKKLGMTVNQETTQSSYWSKQKKEISKIVKTDGIVISFGWNSGGIGIKNGFEILEILLVPHGSNHNDTICTVERKI